VALNVNVLENYTDGPSEDASSIPWTHLKKEGKRKKTIVIFWCPIVGRHIRLSNFIFWYFSKRCDRLELHASCNWKHRDKFLFGSTFSI